MNLILKNCQFLAGREIVHGQIAIEGEFISACGQDLQKDFPKLPLLDLKGALVLPSFTDSHLHLEGYAQSLADLDLRETRSLKEVLKLIEAYARCLKEGDWITGGRWDRNLWGDSSLPNKKELDQVSHGHPAMLFSKDGHALWFNSRAQEIWGLSSSTVDPPGGKILRDEDGEPAGILLENAIDLYVGKFGTLRGLDFNQLKNACLKLQTLGITNANWFYQGNLDPEEVFKIASQLPLDLTIWFPIGSLQALKKEGLKTGESLEKAKLGGIKLFADGALGSQTAFLFEAYEGSTSHGIETMKVEEMAEIIREARECGIGVSVHAIGDAAVYNALSAFLPQKEFNSGLRSRIEHIQLIRWEDIRLFKEAGLIASIQPIHATSDRDLALKYWGERINRSYPYFSLFKAGIPLLAGSDAPVEDPSPLKGIYAATTRMRPFLKEEPFGEKERLPVLEAVLSYGERGAWGSFWEKESGRIEQGKVANLVVLSEDILSDPLLCAQAKVLYTFYHGEATSF